MENMENMENTLNTIEFFDSPHAPGLKVSLCTQFVFTDEKGVSASVSLLGDHSESGTAHVAALKQLKDYLKVQEHKASDDFKSKLLI